MFLLHFVKIIIVHCWRTNEFGQSFLPSSSSKFVQTHNTKIEEDGKSLKRFKNLKSFFLKIGMQINPSLRVSFPIRENQFATALAFLLRPWAVSSKSALLETRNTRILPQQKSKQKRKREKKTHRETRFYLKIQIRIPFGKRRKIRGIDGLVERWVKSGKKEGRERKEKGGERVIHSTAKKSMWQSPRSFVPAASSGRSAIVLI